MSSPGVQTSAGDAPCHVLQARFAIVLGLSTLQTGLTVVAAICLATISTQIGAPHIINWQAAFGKIYSFSFSLASTSVLAHVQPV